MYANKDATLRKVEVCSLVIKHIKMDSAGGIEHSRYNQLMHFVCGRY